MAKVIDADAMFTKEQIGHAFELYLAHDVRNGSFAKSLLAGVVLPMMPQVNKATGHENDPMYIAYVLEYICDQIYMKRHPK